MAHSVPYYLDYQANVTRGIIAAVCCAAIFIIYGIVEKFVLRKRDSTARIDVSTITSSYSKEKGATLHGIGVDNLALDKRE